ncbi:MAG: alpha/beta hydrolase [Lachnospiraceae bacterium]|nr:alpha/beta hydrolase [Lachnospiraceae bacterium]
MKLSQEKKMELAVKLRAPANLPFEIPEGYTDVEDRVTVKTLKIPTSVGENTSYLVEKKGGAENDVLIVNIHGGGFVQPHNPWDTYLCDYYAADLGCKVLDIDYQTCPEVMFPTPMIECYEVVQWAMAHAAELGIDPDKVVVGGNSAGATLSAAVCLKANEQGGKMPAMMLLIYPAADAFITPESDKFLEEELDLTKLETRGILYNSMFTDNDPALADNVYLNLGLLTEEDAQNFPETVVITAAKDYLRVSGEKLAAKIASSGARVTLQRFMNSAHGFYARCSGDWKEARALVYESIQRKFKI